MKIIKPSLYLMAMLGLIFELLVYTGFCFKQFRYIPDDEKVRIAIEYVIKENRKSVAQYKEKAVIYPFSTVEGFFVSRPISYGAYSGLKEDFDWLKKMRGDLSSNVLLEFMGAYQGIPRKVEESIQITNCGDAVWEC